MLRLTVFGILLCFLAFKSSYCLALKDTNSIYHPVTEAVHDPPPQTKTTSTTLTPSTTKATTPVPLPTNLTTTTPTTTTVPTTTKAPTTATTTVAPTSSTPAPTTSPTTSPTTHSPSPITTDKPHPPPPPSDRKFDAMSFLGGFALGLGLVAIGILSWKFYLSRQENYYHTL